MRKILYDYSLVLGLLKMVIYKIAYGSGLVSEGLPHMSNKATIRIRKGGKVILGKNSRLTDGNYLWVTENGVFSIGERSGFGVNCIISCRKEVTIGRNVMFGPFVTVYDNDHVYQTEGTIMEAGYQTAPIVIGDNVWIGNHVKILKGVTIGNGSVIAAGSIVNKDVPAHCVFFNKKEDVIKPITIN